MARAHRITADHASRIRWERHHAQPELWFWNRVDRSGGRDACWPWLGRIMAARGGYGRLKFKGRMVGAHRMALFLASGEDRAGEFACHRCDNPICCNPEHLFWGTPKDNVVDSIVKGRKRGRPGKINVEEMLSLRAQGQSYTQIAARFSVNQASIGKALKRAALRARAQQEN